RRRSNKKDGVFGPQQVGPAGGVGGRDLGDLRFQPAGRAGVQSSGQRLERDGGQADAGGGVRGQRRVQNGAQPSPRPADENGVGGGQPGKGRRRFAGHRTDVPPAETPAVCFQDG